MSSFRDNERLKNQQQSNQELKTLLRKAEDACTILQEQNQKLSSDLDSLKSDLSL
jgi:hypothetical protein